MFGIKRSDINKEQQLPEPFVKEFGTGYLIARQNAVSKELRTSFGERTTVYFREGTEPKCDYLRLRYDFTTNEETLCFYQHQKDIEVDREGQVKVIAEKKQDLDKAITSHKRGGQHRKGTKGSVNTNPEIKAKVLALEVGHSMEVGNHDWVKMPKAIYGYFHSIGNANGRAYRIKKMVGGYRVARKS